MEFECVEYEFDRVEFEIIDADNYVEIIEQSIRTIKETIRCLVQELSFKKITKIITKRLTLVAIRKLNYLPVENIIWNEYTPLLILTSTPLLDIRVYSIDFSAYAKVFKNNRL